MTCGRPWSRRSSRRSRRPPGAASRWSCDLPPSPIRIRHDPQRIGQVVTNLVGNALKFTPRGGAVDVELQSTDDGARIEVRDTGVGIDQSELPHIFERFYRGTMANEARGSGSGLGLAIVKSIVDLHSGRGRSSTAVSAAGRRSRSACRRIRGGRRGPAADARDEPDGPVDVRDPAEVADSSPSAAS